MNYRLKLVDSILKTLSKEVSLLIYTTTIQGPDEEISNKLRRETKDLLVNGMSSNPKEGALFEMIARKIIDKDFERLSHVLKEGLISTIKESISMRKLRK